MSEERRIVTVLFADVAGSTRLGEELDPEDVRALLSRYYDLARDIVHGHGGTVEKFIGDAVMAVFGIPAAHGDDAERAIAAGIALRDAVAAEPGLVQLRPRIGLNTGEVVATGDLSRGDFLVTGDAVNVAARIQQQADPGQLLVGERTRQAAASFAYGEAMSFAAKGKARPLRAWPVVGRAERRAVPTPFVGRGDDLVQLRLVARRAFKESRPYLVTLTAPAGTGKTRLVHELVGQLREELPALRVATAQCLPYGQTLTYWPLRAVTAELLGGPETSSFERTRRRVAAILGGADDEQDATTIAATLWPEQQVASQDRERVFAAWRRLLESLAGHGPLVIVFEDLHWAADSLLDLVDHAMQPHTRAPLLILSIARPELLERRSGWGGGRRNYLNLALEPLTDQEIGELVADLLETEPPAALRRVVVERAEGNPFFAGELVRTLLDRGVTELADPANLAALTDLPATVHATVLARIDLLEQGQREVLQAAAVVGRSFDLDHLGAIVDAQRASVALEGLLARDLVVPSDGGFAFRHILIREVAYQTLPRARRVRDHALLARHLAARVDAESIADLVALHFVEATRLRRGLIVASAEGEMEGDRQQALVWLSRAAAANARVGAGMEAARQLHEAIALATPAEEMGLQEQLSSSYTYGDESLLAAKRAWELWQELGGDQATGALILARYLSVQRWQGAVSPENRPDRETVERLNETALDLASRSGDERVLGMVLAVRSFFPFFVNDRSPELIARARVEASQAEEIFRRLDDPTWLSAALDGLGSIAESTDDALEHHAVASRRQRVLDRLADLAERVDTLVVLAWSCVALGKVNEGLAAARRAVAELPPGRWLGFRLHALAWLCTLSTMAGDWDAALAAARDAVGTWREMGRPWAAYRRRGMSVALFVARRRGDEESAADLSDSLSEVAQPAGVSTGVLARAYQEAVVRDDPASALIVLEAMDQGGASLDAVERLLSLLASTLTRPHVDLQRLDTLGAWARERALVPVEAHLLRLRSIATGGDPEALRRAVELLEACGMVPDRALAQVELAAITRDLALLRSARMDLERIRDEVGLARLSDLEARLRA